jgi:hypothetical protein
VADKNPDLQKQVALLTKQYHIGILTAIITTKEEKVSAIDQQISETGPIVKKLKADLKKLLAEFIAKGKSANLLHSYFGI